MDFTPGNHEIYYIKSTNSGTSWTTGKRLTWTSGSSQLPAIAADPSDNLHLLWNDETPGNNEIYYKKSTDGGATWTASRRLTSTSKDSYSAAVALDSSSHIHVVWHDYTPGNIEIYYMQSTDGGTTWTASKRLTATSGYSMWPDVAADASGNLHVVWHDHTPENVEIYYMKYVK